MMQNWYGGVPCEACEETLSSNQARACRSTPEGKDGWIVSMFAGLLLFCCEDREANQASPSITWS